ncbi:hypothetical protein GJ496_005147 [Pomphorhynchus laevis]|nr:hypothetical protein GJ496_005147 [Pomphorhynchus laevis]
MDIVKELCAGGVGGMCSLTVGFPFDTVKVTMQRTSSVEGIFGAVNLIRKKSGIRGFFTGMMFPLFGVFPIYAMCFGTYGYARTVLSQLNNQNNYDVFIAGMISAIPALILITPGERIKCILQINQLQNKNNHAARDNPIKCAQRIIQKDGFLKLFRGIGITAFREIPANGIWFATYELLKDRLNKKTNNKKSFATTLFAGGVAGVCTWIYAMPFDFIKTRIQTDQNATYRHVIYETKGRSIPGECCLLSRIRNYDTIDESIFLKNNYPKKVAVYDFFKYLRLRII